MVSKSETQSLIAGQPSEVSPSPPKAAYVVALSRPSKNRLCLTVSAMLERKDGTGSPEMSVGRPPAAKSYNLSEAIPINVRSNTYQRNGQHFVV